MYQQVFFAQTVILAVISSIFDEVGNYGGISSPAGSTPSPPLTTEFKPPRPRLARCLRAADSETLADSSMRRLSCTLFFLLLPFCSFLCLIVRSLTKVDGKIMPGERIIRTRIYRPVRYLFFKLKFAGNLWVEWRCYRFEQQQQRYCCCMVLGRTV